MPPLRSWTKQKIGNFPSLPVLFPPLSPNTRTFEIPPLPSPSLNQTGPKLLGSGLGLYFFFKHIATSDISVGLEPKPKPTGLIHVNPLKRTGWTRRQTDPFYKIVGLLGSGPVRTHLDNPNCRCMKLFPEWIFMFKHSLNKFLVPEFIVTFCFSLYHIIFILLVPIFTYNFEFDRSPFYNISLLIGEIINKWPCHHYHMFRIILFCIFCFQASSNGSLFLLK